MQVTTYLADRSFEHSLMGTQDTYSTCKNNDDPFVYTVTTNPYTSATFYGVVIDTGALKKSIAGFNQYIAYKRTQEGADIDKLTKGSISIQFGIGSTNFINFIYI